MTEFNIHSNYIHKPINNKWNSKIIDTSHEDFIKDYASNVFTNLIRNTFTASYIKQFPCSIYKSLQLKDVMVEEKNDQY